MSLTGAYSRIMNCRYCGKKVERGQKYCPHCGEPIRRNPCNGTQVDASEIIKSGVNAGIDGFGKGWKQGGKIAENLIEASENHPRTSDAITSTICVILCIVFLMVGGEHSFELFLLFAFFSAVGWYRFFRKGK